MSRPTFSGFNIRSRPPGEREEPDEWLLDAARKAGHALPAGERPAGTTAWRVLLSAGLPEEAVLQLACAASGAGAADLSRLSPSLAGSLPHSLALEHHVAPVGIHDGALDVATSNPRNPALERELAFAARQRVRLLAASPSDVVRAQGMIYGNVNDQGAGAEASVPAPAPAAAPPPIMQPRPAPVARLSLSATEPPEAEPDDDAERRVPDAADDAFMAIERDDTHAPSASAATAEDAAEPIAGAPIDAVPVDAEAVAAAPGRTAPARAPRPPRPPRQRPPPAPPAPAAPPASPPPDLSDRLLTTAAAERASEAVLEPQEDGGLLVRLSTDGTLSDRFKIPRAHTPRLIAGLKERASLDAAESSRAQHGRFTFGAIYGPVAVRLSCLPITGTSERLLLRLRSRRDQRDLADLGFTRDEQHRVQTLLRATPGLVVVAGPAGAGRTTTLYAAARELQRERRLDRTIEELIELPVLEDGHQTELRDTPHPTMAAAVRALGAVEGGALVLGAPLDALTLAQCDPELGVQRLVLAPIASTDAPAAVGRLRKLHLDRDRLADTLSGVIAQRLVRRLCDACAVSQRVADLPEQQRHLVDGLPTAKMRRPEGCGACRGTGYLGRSAIVEVLAVTPDLRDAIAREANEAELAALLRANGMPSLWDSGLHRVLEGETSLAELLDILPAPVASGGGAPQEDIDALLSQLLGSPLVPARPRKPAPVRAAEPEAAVVDDDVAPETAAEAAAEPTRHRAPGVVRVLLVNDDAVVRRALAQSLTAAGLHVLQVADGNAAVAFVRRLHPDVVLTEVALPGLDAIGMLGALAGDAAPPAVVVHTEQADDALDAWLREAGAGDVLRHDLPVDDLVRRLRELAQR
jgi:general secretion pathway protein E